MEYELNATPADGYVHVRVRGQNDVATAQRWARELIALCAEKGWKNLLVEENLAGPRLSLVDIFGIISKEAPAASPHIHLMAFVDSSPERDPFNVRFGETVALNRGLSVKVFDTVPQAESWLRARLSKDAESPLRAP
jgi:hypothetical protein